MPIDTNLYLEEMRNLMSNAAAKWRRDSHAPLVYAISIWTDPEARVSSVSFETRAHSDEWVREANQFAKNQRDDLEAGGDHEMASLFEVQVDRNTSPADSLFASYLTKRHRSFDKEWGQSDECWLILEPLLVALCGEGQAIFAEVPAEPDAEIAVNSESEWYDVRLKLGKGA